MIALPSAALVAAVQATPAATAAAPRGLSSVELFAAADAALAAGRREDALAMYAALARDPDAEVRAEARYRMANELTAAGLLREAARTYRALLDEKPGAAGVRLALARLLAMLGDEAGARAAVRQAQAAGLPPQVALVADQFAVALRSRRRLGGSVEAAIAPDSNINRATAARTLDTVIAPLVLSGDARARSGLGVRGSAQGFARLPVANRWALLPRVSGRGSLYRQHRFDDVAASALVGMEWQGGRDRLTPSIGQTWRWYGGALYATTQTASLDWLHPAGARGQIVAGASVSRARYRGNALQDGAIIDLTIGVERALGARGGGGITLSGTRQTARDAGYATVAGGIGAIGWRELGSATLVATGSVRRTEGDERLFLFADRRREWLTQASVAVTWRRLAVGGIAPLARIGWERNRSSVGLYDYRRVSTELGLSRAF
ncbi:surface lipoprotein assembly modifier [Sphingomonas sp. 1P08PE]|uniref:surface lipoprotein assembly modifier n=1 Tax=Sphingomonas sp. 1P08PE TaxID=554122 RepID=UPI0039A34716